MAVLCLSHGQAGLPAATSHPCPPMPNLAFHSCWDLRHCHNAAASTSICSAKLRLQDSPPHGSSPGNLVSNVALHSSLPGSAKAQEPSHSSSKGTWAGDGGRATTASEDTLSPARLEGPITLIFLINQSNTIFWMLLLIALSCPRLAGGWS